MLLKKSGYVVTHFFTAEQRGICIRIRYIFSESLLGSDSVAGTHFVYCKDINK